MSEWTKVGERPTEDGDYWVEFDDGGVEFYRVRMGAGGFTGRGAMQVDYPASVDAFATARWCPALCPPRQPRRDVFDEIADEYFKVAVSRMKLSDYLRKNADRIRSCK